MYNVEWQNHEGHWLSEYVNLSISTAMHIAYRMRQQGIPSARVVCKKNGTPIPAEPTWE